MTTYTAINLTLPIRPDTPREIIEFLRDMYDVESHLAYCDTLPPGIYEQRPAPAFIGALGPHRLFQTHEWDMLLSPFSGGGSDFADFEGPTSSFTLGRGGQPHELRIRSSFKNYDSEIEALFDWLLPFVQPVPPGTAIGWQSSQDIGYVYDLVWAGDQIDLTNRRDWFDDALTEPTLSYAPFPLAAPAPTLPI